MKNTDQKQVKSLTDTETEIQIGRIRNQQEIKSVLRDLERSYRNEAIFYAAVVILSFLCLFGFLGSSILFLEVLIEC